MTEYLHVLQTRDFHIEKVFSWSFFKAMCSNRADVFGNVSDLHNLEKEKALINSHHHGGANTWQGEL